jgi:hypothetical protein
MEERSKLNDVSPKDVKQLEVLKPIKTPSMGERYKQALDKEKRLEAASRPVQKTSKSKEPKSETEEPAPKNKRKRAQKKKIKSQSLKVEEGALDQQDEVEEGINWSDDDE